MATYISRLPAVIKQYSKSRSSIYAEISTGLFVPPVRIGLRAVGWPENEIDAIIAARVAGKNDGEVREIVRSLVAARKFA